MRLYRVYSKAKLGRLYKKLTYTCSEIRTLLNFEFEYDIHFVISAYNLKKEAIKTNDNFSNKDYEQARSEFLKIMDVYIYTEWERIKLETIGKKAKRNRGIRWDKLYAANIEKYNKASLNALKKDYECIL